MQAPLNRTLQQVKNEEVIDLKLYWRIIMSHKWGIISFSILITLLSAFIVFNITPIYKGTTTLLIESQQTNVVSIQEVYGLENSNEYLITQFEILKSRKIAHDVILKLNLIDHPSTQEKTKSQLSVFIKQVKETISKWLPDNTKGHTKPNTNNQKMEAAINSFLAHLVITPIRKTQLVRISFESVDAELAAAVANEVANTYIENNLAAKLELTIKATTWLNSQLKNQRKELTAAEQKLQKYREQQGIVGSNSGFNIAEREIDLVSTKLVDAKRELLESKNLYDQIQNFGRNNATKLQLIPAILGHELVQSLKNSVADIEIRRSEISNRYGRKHPKMKSINSERSRAYSNLNKQIISIARGIENRYKVAVAAVDSLQESLNKTKNDMQVLGSKEYKLKELQQDVDTKRDLYDQFYKRFSETTATGDLKTANARITDKSPIPNQPIKPNKKLIVTIAFLISLCFAIAIAFLVRALDNTIKTSLEVESKLNEAVLGVLPLLGKNKNNRQVSYNQYLDAPHSNYSETLRTIRTGIILSSLDKPFKTISVTSTTPEEGKTSVSIGLAQSLAQLGSVILIDADMRKPSIQRALELETNNLGLSNLVAQTQTMQECIATYSPGGFDVLPCGTLPPNPSELLSSQRFKDLISTLEEKYDRIIIDTPPCHAVSDALVLSPITDTYIYVVNANLTATPLIKNNLNRIHQANGHISGIVLNKVDLKKAEKYYGENYNSYYGSYSYSGTNN